MTRSGRNLLKFASVFAAALFACSTTAAAQGTSVGVKAGVNLADLSVKEAGSTFNASNRTGLVAGVFVTISGGGLFAFQPEVLISMQGAKFTDESDSGTAKIDYLQVPLLARIKPSKSPVGIVVGPAIGYRIRAELSAEEPDEDFADQIKRTDLGLVTGVVVDVAHVVLDGRYTWGLTNIGKDSGDSKIKNRVASVTLGFRF